MRPPSVLINLVVTGSRFRISWVWATYPPVQQLPSFGPQDRGYGPQDFAVQASTYPKSFQQIHPCCTAHPPLTVTHGRLSPDTRRGLSCKGGYQEAHGREAAKCNVFKGGPRLHKFCLFGPVGGLSCPPLEEGRRLSIANTTIVAIFASLAAC